jgi:hypothetical protein
MVTPLTSRTYVLSCVGQWQCLRPLSAPLLPGSKRAGGAPPYGSETVPGSRPKARSRLASSRRTRNPRSIRSRRFAATSSRRVFPRSMRRLGRVACHARRARRSAVISRAARRRSRCAGWRRHRPRDRSSPISILRGRSIPTKRCVAVSTWAGSSSSGLRTTRRALRSEARCWPVARSTCWWSTCPAGFRPLRRGRFGG